MTSKMIHLLVATLCIGFLSAAPVNETVAYENSSTSNPSDPHVLSSVDIIVPQIGNSSAALHMMPTESDDDHEDNDHHYTSSETTKSTSLSPLSFDEEDTTETGPSTKSTHIMVIPRKNVTMQSENATDFSGDEDSSASSYDHDYHSKGSSLSSTSILAVLGTISLSVLIQ